MSKKPSFRDLTQLSAYLDGELSASARKKMEDRLARLHPERGDGRDPELAAALDDLRLSRTVLRRTPQRRAPRNFTLSPQMVAKRPPMPSLVPALNYAALAAMLLFVFSFTSPFGAGGSMADQAIESAPMVAMEMEEMAAPAAEAPMEMAAEPAAADSAMEEAPAGEAAAEAELPAAEAPTAESGENLAAAPPAPEATVEATVEGAPAEKTVAATETPIPTDLPFVRIAPPLEPEPAPLLTSYQRTLIILLGLFVIFSWVVRRATIAKWQRKSK